MKKWLAFVCLPAAVIAASIAVANARAAIQAPSAAAPAYLIDDEFNGPNGSEPSSALWDAKDYGTYKGWKWIWENGQGDLRIVATDETGSWEDGFLSSKIGYSGPRHVEVAAKVPCAYGTWSGPVWEWGYPYGGGPSIENDVIEQLGRLPTIYYSTLHYWDATGGDHSSGSQAIDTGQTLCKAKHVYASDVYADHIDYFFDGAKVATVTAASVGVSDLTSYEEVANISLDVGGWGGTPTFTGRAALIVDYIRVSPLP